MKKRFEKIISSPGEGRAIARKMEVILPLALLVLIFLAWVQPLQAEQKTIEIPKGTRIQKLGPGHFKFVLPNHRIIELKGLNPRTGEAGSIGLVDPNPPHKPIAGKQVKLLLKRLPRAEAIKLGESDHVQIDDDIAWLPLSITFQKLEPMIPQAMFKPANATVPPSVPAPSTSKTATAAGLMMFDLCFAPGSLATEPLQPRAGSLEAGETELKAEIQNLGDAPARNLKVRFDLYRGSEHIMGFMPQSIAVLNGKSKYRVSQRVMPYSLPQAGSYTLHAGVGTDPAAANESDKNNNHATLPITIVGPDFVVSGTDIVMSPSNPGGGQEFSASAPVLNEGGAPSATSIRIGLYDSSGRLIAEESFYRSIPAGGHVYVSKSFNLPAGYGNYRILVEADGDGRVVESDEGNNRGNKFFVSAR